MTTAFGICIPCIPVVGGGVSCQGLAKRSVGSSGVEATLTAGKDGLLVSSMLKASFALCSIGDGRLKSPLSTSPLFGLEGAGELVFESQPYLYDEEVPGVGSGGPCNGGPWSLLCVWAWLAMFRSTAFNRSVLGFARKAGFLFKGPSAKTPELNRLAPLPRLLGRPLP